MCADTNSYSTETCPLRWLFTAGRFPSRQLLRLWEGLISQIHLVSSEAIHTFSVTSACKQASTDTLKKMFFVSVTG